MNLRPQSRLLGLALALIGSTAMSPARAANPSDGPSYVPPSWSQTLPVERRFVVLANMANAAVLDRETGLVWERSPNLYVWNWYQISLYCNRLTVGGRMGWRVPTAQELASLVDPSVPAPGPTLPAGHPFSNVITSIPYWSATTAVPGVPGQTIAWSVSFQFSDVSYFPKTDYQAVWCVRGGQGADPQ